MVVNQDQMLFSLLAREFLLSVYTLEWTAYSLPCAIRNTEVIKSVVCVTFSVSMCSYVKLIFLILKVTNMMMLKGSEVIPSRG
jgi:hypothetical protein